MLKNDKKLRNKEGELVEDEKWGRQRIGGVMMRNGEERELVGW